MERGGVGQIPQPRPIIGIPTFWPVEDPPPRWPMLSLEDIVLHLEGPDFPFQQFLLRKPCLSL